MTLFIGDISALQLLVSRGTPMRNLSNTNRRNALALCRAKPIKGVRSDWRKVADLGFPDGVGTEALHVNVATSEDRSKSGLLRCHVWTGPDRGTYLRVDDDYCVMTPEACFAQLAGRLSFSHLAELGFMLCGTYAPASEPGITRYDVPPLSSPQKLQRYVARLEDKNGIENARAVANLVSSGSGSAMESKIATVLSLGTRRGGVGKPPALNSEIALSQEARGLGLRNVRRPDFLWLEYGVAMDYDSREYHDVNEALAADEERRNELAAVGLKGIVARRHHFRSALAFEALMGQLFSAAGWRMRSRVRELPRKRFELYQEMFGSKQWRPMDEK